MHPCSDSTPLKVLVLESISSTAVEEFKAAGFQVDEIHHLSEDQLVEKLPSYAIVGVRSKTKLTPRVLRAAELLAIGCFCIGTDQTDLVVAAENAVPVFNAPFANTRSVAEVVLAHIISLSRRIPDDIRNMHAGIWKKSATNKHEVRGLKLGIVGYGHVGSQLSVLAEAFGMDVRFFDIIPKLPLGNATPISTLDELLSTSDVVTLHVPFTDRTAGMIGEREIATMKDGAFLINYARGKCCDVPRVAEALRSGKLGGAAFDVFPSEPSSKDVEFKSELRGCPNTILTPHIGIVSSVLQSLTLYRWIYSRSTGLDWGRSRAEANFLR